MLSGRSVWTGEKRLRKAPWEIPYRPKMWAMRGTECLQQAGFLSQLECEEIIKNWVWWSRSLGWLNSRCISFTGPPKAWEGVFHALSTHSFSLVTEFLAWPSAVLDMVWSSQKHLSRGWSLLFSNRKSSPSKWEAICAQPEALIACLET